MRYQGKDLNALERIVREYYQSDRSNPYYTRLSSKDLWKGMVRRTSFLYYCKQAQRILDFGCGSGCLAISLSKKFPAKKIFANDIGNAAESLISSRTSEHNLIFRKASVLSSGFPENSMDMIISHFVIEHVVYPQNFLTEAHRILVPGGVLYLVYPHLLFKISFCTLIIELISWITLSEKPTYLNPQINDRTYQGGDRDAVWVSNHVKIVRMLKRAGFHVANNILTESLIIAKKPSIGRTGTGKHGRS